MTLTDLIHALNQRSARLSRADDGKLAIHAPPGSVTPELKEALAAHRVTLLATLAPATEPAVAPPASKEPVAEPLKNTVSRALPPDFKGLSGATTKNTVALPALPASAGVEPKQRHDLPLDDSQAQLPHRAFCSTQTVVGLQLVLPDELWRALTDYLALTEAAADPGLGGLLRGFSVPLPGHADVTVHVDVLNSRPRPVIDAYVQQAGRTVRALPPAYNLDRPLCFTYDGRDYWLVLRPAQLLG